MSTVLRHRATAKQLDPSRTSVLIRLYSRALSKKLDALKTAIRQALVDRDVFGVTRGLLLHIDLPPEKAWSVLDLAGKNKAFGKWLNDTLTSYFLEDTGLAADVTPQWIQQFIRAAYSKGAASALASIAATIPEA